MKIPATTNFPRTITIVGFVFIVLLGVGLRFFHIAQSDFFFYDEGYYLAHNRGILELIEKNPPTNLRDYLRAAYLVFRVSLRTGKAFWFMISDSRVLFKGLTAWYFPRIVSAIIGTATCLFLFLFSRKYFQSSWTALLATAFLLILPSHVFYSRLAIQEVLSTFLFLIGIYFYLFPRRFGWRTFVSGMAMGLVFFTNYRMIVLPMFVSLYELYLSWSEKRQFDIRKLLWHSLVFFSMVFLIGNIDHGRNTYITFAWMFYQAHLAGGQQIDLLNFLSYPYYIFRLEGIFFGILFFSSGYFLYRREWKNFFPAFIVLLQMGVFSFASEKGARYLCVVLPFMCMAVSAIVIFLFEERKTKIFRVALGVFVVLVVITMGNKSLALARSQSGYRSATEYLKKKGGTGVKFFSTQNWIQGLYVDHPDNSLELTRPYWAFVKIFREKDYRYLVLGPQAYVSWTEDKERFSPPLKGFLEFIRNHVVPEKIFPHFNGAMAERFVLEHNVNLRKSLLFLKTRDRDFGLIKVYDVKQCIDTINKALKRHQPKLNK